MKLSKIALLALKGSGPKIKEDIADALGVTSKTVYRWIQDNDDNLTKAAALKVIREELGVADSELLESEPTTA